ncbi:MULTISPECIES: enoyl-CoA hydratase/isomerase family protein [Actinomadura]|uniref:Enoyl-CoA hydratase/isomerase family protein n=1 Tax=Actinomadura litoris TaxID=2678616 RepID=A0A7K1L1Z3_9ACTN|nr:MULTISPECIES: enoyl-CoA hydratase/isomerase family protein [Actinomadura]MBT2208971.1 enoyl-CoA hydratase/isomerase family protein [Actinomadura sp. NEAU-AAG7]MUN38464.1 enoyl-CoA hydratase/isomerase family protein [Actinomadura litoris]
MLTRETSTDVLVTEDHGAVRVLRLNRPAKLNALNTELTAALLAALQAADADGAVRAVVLTGTGRAFCAGADLTEFKDLTPADQGAVVQRAELTMRSQMLPQQLTKPVVSAVRGHAMGGGAGLAIGCDMMVAASDTRLGYPELRHSLVPAVVMTGLQRHFGRKLAFELVSTGRILSAAELAEYGIANRVVEPGEEVEAALEIATGWAEVNADAMIAAKALFYRVADLPFEEAMRTGADVNAIMRGFRP